jgi:hypothetical protein
MKQHSSKSHQQYVTVKDIRHRFSAGEPLTDKTTGLSSCLHHAEGFEEKSLVFCDFRNIRDTLDLHRQVLVARKKTICTDLKRVPFAYVSPHSERKFASVAEDHELSFVSFVWIVSAMAFPGIPLHCMNKLY